MKAVFLYLALAFPASHAQSYQEIARKLLANPNYDKSVPPNHPDVRVMCSGLSVNYVDERLQTLNVPLDLYVAYDDDRLRWSLNETGVGVVEIDRSRLWQPSVRFLGKEGRFRFRFHNLVISRPDLFQNRAR